MNLFSEFKNRLTAPVDASYKPFTRSPLFWAALASIVWGVFVFIAFMGEKGHEEYWCGLFAFLDLYFPAHLEAGLILLAAGSLGALLLRLFGYACKDRLELALSSLALGIAALTLSGFLLGVIGWYHCWQVRGVSLAILITSALLLFILWLLKRRQGEGQTMSDGASCPKADIPVGDSSAPTADGIPIACPKSGNPDEASCAPPPRCSFGVAEYFCLIILALVLFMTWINCLLPPSRGDAVIEYLPRARLWAEHGWSWPAPGDWSNARVLLALGWAMGGIERSSEAICALLMFSMGLATLAAMALWLRILGARQRWPIAALMLAACPVFMGVADCAAIDTVVAFFCLMGAWQLFCWREDRRLSHLILSALFLGYAVGCKPLAIYACVASAVAMFVFCLARDSTGRRRLRLWSVYLLLLAVGPGYTVYNFARTGDPLYPYLSETLSFPQGTTTGKTAPPSSDGNGTHNSHNSPISHTSQPTPSDVEAQFHRGWVSTTRFGSAPLDWLLLPWRATISGQYPNDWGNTILPTFLMLAPLLLLVRGPTLAGLALWLLVYFAVWALQPQFIRYGFPGLALLAVLLTALLERLKPALRPVAVWGALLIPATLATGSQTYEFVRMGTSFLPCLTSNDPMVRIRYLFKSPIRHSYTSIEQLYAYMGDKKMRVLFFGEMIGYYCQVECEPDNSNLTALRRLRATADDNPTRGLEIIRQRGFTHVLFDEGLFRYFYLDGKRLGASPALKQAAEDDMAFFEKMSRLGMKQLYSKDRVSIYEVLPQGVISENGI
ncbi:MAG: hypothetical protein NTX50_14230 [Candidatus Sumerlaeota bacterium]|nr:hypothetical protein [Candidatus Sumerlaeota bacterium]